MKKSIKFDNYCEVRAICDDENNKRLFSVSDIVRAINKESDYIKAGNYWPWLKKEQTSKRIQLVSDTHEFKSESSDIKQRKTDVLDAEAASLLAKNHPNNHANALLEWFYYSDNTLDGQSIHKAYELMKNSNLRKNIERIKENKQRLIIDVVIEQIKVC